MFNKFSLVLLIESSEYWVLFVPPGIASAVFELILFSQLFYRLTPHFFAKNFRERAEIIIGNKMGFLCSYPYTTVPPEKGWFILCCGWGLASPQLLSGTPKISYLACSYQNCEVIAASNPRHHGSVVNSCILEKQ